MPLSPSVRILDTKERPPPAWARRRAAASGHRHFRGGADRGQRRGHQRHRSVRDEVELSHRLSGRAEPPDASNVNFPPGIVLANLVTSGLSSGGAVDIYNNVGTVDVLGDVEGYFMPQPVTVTSGEYTPIPPIRVCDLRFGQPINLCNGLNDGKSTRSGPTLGRQGDGSRAAGVVCTQLRADDPDGRNRGVRDHQPHGNCRDGQYLPQRCSLDNKRLRLRRE